MYVLGQKYIDSCGAALQCGEVGIYGSFSKWRGPNIDSNILQSLL